MNALSEICLRRLGYDPHTLPEHELRSRLPDILKAIDAEASMIGNALIVVQKSAVTRRGSFIPNPGIEREETVEREATDAPPDNSVFDSIFAGF